MIGSQPWRSGFGSNAFLWIVCLSPLFAWAGDPIRVVQDVSGLPIAIETEAGSPTELERWQKAAAGGADFGSVLSLTVAPTSTEDLPPMVGSHSLAGSTLRFTPRYPLRSGMRYRAHRRDIGGRSIEKMIELPAESAKAATYVSNVFPSGEMLPENQLRFYIHFSAPMQQGDAYHHVGLSDDQGSVIADPFLELGEEFWDPSGRRFTLLIDPGRIKRGLKPREEVDPVFESGKSYTLVIRSTWLDAAGQPLASDWRKEFRVGPPQESPLDSKAWSFAAPRAGSVEPLQATFDRPLDHALLLRCLRVERTNGESVAGKANVGAGERNWSFVPEQPWKSDRYSLIVDRDLEDSSGNRIGRSFEVDAVEAPAEALSSEPIRIPFTIMER